MARLNLTVEGQTEQMFVVRSLKGHLASHNVFVRKPRLTALGKKKGRVHRGGLRSYEPARNDIIRWLTEDQDPDAYFTTMIDLFRLPKDFPGYRDAAAIRDAYDRVAKLESALAEDIQDPRFVPYIQLHEFEALLLSDPAGFGCYYDKNEYARGIRGLLELCARHPPELIDDGEQTAPSKRIGKEIPDYLHAKPTAGPIIAEHIGLDTIRKKCPHFDQWLKRLEALTTPSSKQ
jgi:hypothetical protein